MLNIVPGLIVIVLTFSTLFVTTLAITRERERGTMENLLAMPVRPIEVMIAKIIPYVFIGYVQVGLILVASVVFFDLPVRGSLPLLLGALGLFIASNLALGVTFSTIAANQMQAVQLAQFTLMPSFMLSGFMFPFRGMPVWAQVVGNFIPDHPRDAHRPRHAVEGQRLERDRAGDVADGAVHGRRHRLRRVALSRDARLTRQRGFAEVDSRLC